MEKSPSQFFADLAKLLQDFEIEIAENNHDFTITDFKQWIYKQELKKSDVDSAHIYWEGKENGRSQDSVITTLLVHLNRYSKNYSKAAILNSKFSTQDDFVYLINLKAFGSMSKMDLIKRNITDKPTGIQIINRLIANGWVEQSVDENDKRTKKISITANGLQYLNQYLPKIKQASSIVSGNLTSSEKLDLIRLLQKLENFHQNIYKKNIDTEHLLQSAISQTLN